MSEVAVYHNDLTLNGGGESVCMSALDGLCRHHDVTLFTRIPPDFGALNQYYDTSVEDVRVVSFRDWDSVRRPLSALSRVAEQLTGRQLRRFRRAVFLRLVAERTVEFDVALDTSGEGLPGAVVYRHKPEGPDIVAGSLRRVLSNALAGRRGPTAESTTLLANSEWTANEITARCGIRPTVVYPPVHTADLQDGLPWSEREPGFVALGRISPEKNVLRSIDIVERLVERGHDTHLHIIGPAHDRAYVERVRARADGERIRYEGRLPRDELVELLRTHRYGIHGREREHFGISVAEMVATGMLPFVPDDGGQREVVGGDERLTYDTPRAAIARAERVLSDSALADDIRQGLPDVEECFGRERFQRQIREILATQVDSETTWRSSEGPA